MQTKKYKLPDIDALLRALITAQAFIGLHEASRRGYCSCAFECSYKHWPPRGPRIMMWTRVMCGQICTCTAAVKQNIEANIEEMRVHSRMHTLGIDSTSHFRRCQLQLSAICTIWSRLGCTPDRVTYLSPNSDEESSHWIHDSNDNAGSPLFEHPLMQFPTKDMLVPSSR